MVKTSFSVKRPLAEFYKIEENNLLSSKPKKALFPQLTNWPLVIPLICTMKEYALPRWNWWDTGEFNLNSSRVTGETTPNQNDTWARSLVNWHEKTRYYATVKHEFLMPGHFVALLCFTISNSTKLWRVPWWLLSLFTIATLI